MTNQDIIKGTHALKLAPSITRKIDMSRVKTLDDVLSIMKGMGLVWTGTEGTEPEELKPYLED